MLPLTSPTHAQPKQVLYAGLVNSKGYVVGAKLSASGMYQFGRDTTWHHIGLNHPRVSAIAFDPTNPEVIFMACGNGALRSLDRGKHWKITTDWRVTETQDICVDPNDPQSFYLATAYGIFRTHDQGESWAESNTGLPKKYTQVIAADRNQKGRLLAATEGGICLSTDGAKTWTVVGAKGMITSDVKQSASQPSIWIAGTDSNGVLLSNDNGLSWRFAEGSVKTNQSIQLPSTHLTPITWRLRVGTRGCISAATAAKPGNNQK